ncbi:MAG: cytochrome C, partial [Hyphomicrobium sp.]
MSLPSIAIDRQENRIVRGISWLAAGLLALVFSAFAANAQTIFEKLVMPGDVTEAHVKFEKTCESCHEPFSKTSQRRLCLECHKEISSDIAGKRGLHGKRPDIVNSECKVCHSDHKGRGADIVQFDRETFLHAATNFALKGAHANVACERCHAKNQKFRKAPSECIGCHKEDDKHKGALGKECASCHNEDSWRKQKTFDHSKTKFPLKGAHDKVACAVCHIGERYKDLPHACVDCHKMQDPHKSRYGAKCETCHGQDKWKTVKFDHAKDTKFALRGAHEKVKCDVCHRGDIYRDKLPVACVTCHKSNDVHKGELGTACQKCHNEKAWRKDVAFDHDMTRFPLIGLHAALPCEDCHRSAAYRDTSRTCAACHKDEHHQGKLGDACQRCHNPNGWTE